MRMEHLTREPDGRLRSPSAGRNRAEILPVLGRVLGGAREVLEIASGTGEHAVYFAQAMLEVAWQPTDRDAAALDSIAAWRARADLGNLLPPVRCDVERLPWPVDRADAVVAINLLHISPWSTTVALLAGAASVLPERGVLFVYGAMFRDGFEPESSNVAFDAALRARDPRFGVRRLEDVVRTAGEHDLDLDEVVEMPNHNLVVVLRRLAPPSRAQVPAPAGP